MTSVDRNVVLIDYTNKLISSAMEVLMQVPQANVINSCFEKG